MDIQTTTEILLIEDDHAEARLITEVFEEFKPNINITDVNDGINAMDYLYKRGKYKDSKTPSLIILDLNLPKKDGHEVLKEIKLDKELKCIPVVVLTTSDDDRDILEAYENHVNAYLTKPTDIDEFTKVIRIFEDFWINKATLPKRD